MNLRSVIITLLAAGVISGCATDSSSETADPTPTATFTTPEPLEGRWNWTNDGTQFEPCTALDEDDLAAYDLDPTTWADISTGPDTGPGFRGCRATSPTRTMTVTVYDIDAHTLYTPRHLSKSRQLLADTQTHTPTGFDLHRFATTDACVASTPVGESTIMVSVTDDTAVLTNQPEPDYTTHTLDLATDPLCTTAAQLLTQLHPHITPTTPTPNTPLLAPARASYLWAIQAGSLRHHDLSNMTGITEGLTLTDDHHRILSRQDYRTIDAQGVTVSLGILGDRLLTDDPDYPPRP